MSSARLFHRVHVALGLHMLHIPQQHMLHTLSSTCCTLHSRTMPSSTRYVALRWCLHSSKLSASPVHSVCQSCGVHMFAGAHACRLKHGRGLLQSGLQPGTSDACRPALLDRGSEHTGSCCPSPPWTGRGKRSRRQRQPAPFRCC